LRDDSFVSPFRPTLTLISVEQILRVQGYSDMARVRPEILRVAEWASETISRVATPLVSFKRLDVVGRDVAAIRFSGGIVCHGIALLHSLRNCDEVVIFVQTLGDGPDRQGVELAERGESLLEALLLETAGWLALEATIRQFKLCLRDVAALRRRKLHPRLGPGYTYRVPGGDAMWPLQDQRNLFAAFGTDESPVRLLESCAMQPKMSRSGLFGESPTERESRSA
jgi:hypothetical protein